MRYQLLLPPSPIDLRGHYFRTIDELHILCPPFKTYDEEAGAALCTQGMYPAGVALPAMAVVGNRTRWLLGVVDIPIEQIDPECAMPFALFVMALPDSDRDRARIEQSRHFDIAMWRPLSSSDRTRIVTADDVGRRHDPGSG